MYPPSIYAHTLNGLLLLFAVYLFIINYGFIKKMDANKKIEMTLFFALVIGVHSISHAVLEAVYNFNPLNYWYSSV